MASSKQVAMRRMRGEGTLVLFLLRRPVKARGGAGRREGRGQMDGARRRNKGLVFDLDLAIAKWIRLGSGLCRDPAWNEAQHNNACGRPELSRLLHREGSRIDRGRARETSCSIRTRQSPPACMPRTCQTLLRSRS